ncbi:transposase [Turicimonas muris]
MILEEFPEFRTFSNRVAFWSTSYFVASAGGVTIETLEKYVQDQGKTKRLSSPPFRTEVSRRMS